MKTVAEINTHIAILENNLINIYQKGMDPLAVYPEWSLAAGERVFDDEDLLTYPDWFKNELCYSVPLENEDDVFAMMERLAENNRCNVAEASAALC